MKALDPFCGVRSRAARARPRVAYLPDPRSPSDVQARPYLRPNFGHCAAGKLEEQAPDPLEAGLGTVATDTAKAGAADAPV